MANYKEVLNLTQKRLETGTSFLPLELIDSDSLNDVVAHLERSQGAFYIGRAERAECKRYLRSKDINLARRAMVAFAFFDNDTDTLRALPLVAGSGADVDDRHWDIWRDCWDNEIADDSENVLVANYPDYAEAVIFRTNEGVSSFGIRADELKKIHFDALIAMSTDMPDTAFHIKKGTDEIIMKNGMNTSIHWGL